MPPAASGFQMRRPRISDRCTWLAARITRPSSVRPAITCWPLRTAGVMWKYWNLCPGDRTSTAAPSIRLAFPERTG